MKKFLSSLPIPVKEFLLTGAIIFTLWKIVFHLWLQPVQWPDKPLVNAIAANTCSGLNLFHSDDPFSFQTKTTAHGLGDKKEDLYKGTKAAILKKEKPVLTIVPNCNALELMVLFAGFIIAFPGRSVPKFWFIPAGIVAIHLVNVLRSMALVQLASGIHYKYFNFAHHYLFSLTIYLFIFLLWVVYIKHFAVSKIPKQ